MNSKKELVAIRLSKYIDEEIKQYKKIYSYQDISLKIEESIMLIQFISDKDIFETSYRKILTKRLFLQGHFFIEVENLFSQKAKIECGNVFTNKCENMLNDAISSQKSYSEFILSNYYNRNSEKKTEMFINVISPGNWPLSSNDNQININDFLKTFQLVEKSILDNIFSFGKYYSAHYSGRHLGLILTLGNMDINLKFKDRLYLFNMTTIQGFTTYFFQKFPQIEISLLVNFFSIKDKTVLFNHLLPLIKIGLIQPDIALNLEFKKDISEQEIRNILEYSSNNVKLIKFNNNFFFKQNKLSFRELIDLEKSISKDSSIIDIQRKHLIESNIIRIMKSKLNIEHKELISDVLNSLDSYFIPQTFEIKDRIENLISREFIKRDDKALNKYIYIA